MGNEKNGEKRKLQPIFLILQVNSVHKNFEHPIFDSQLTYSS